MIKLDKCVDKDFGHGYQILFLLWQEFTPHWGQRGFPIAFRNADPGLVPVKGVPKGAGNHQRIGLAPQPVILDLFTVNDINLQPIEQ